MPRPKVASWPYMSPHSGSLEKLEAGPWSHSSPRSRPRNLQTGDPRPVVTQDVCARACKCGCMCVRILLISLGNLESGWRRWAIGGCQVQYHPARKESGGEACRAPTGGISVWVMGWGSAVLRCLKCWRGTSVYFLHRTLPSSELVVEGCPKFVF